MTTQWIDFAEVKEKADFATVLDRYGIEYPRKQGQALIRCPFHDDTNPSCSVNFEQKLFNCFSCGESGDILDFVAKMDQVSTAEAARTVAMYSGPPVEGGALPREAANTNEPERENRPLTFRLDLDPTHPYLFERGLTPEVIEHFGVGYCNKGLLKGRIAIPIHDRAGSLVAYAGRWASGEIPDGVEKYLLPRGFKKRMVLFNYHRIVGLPSLLIVEGYWSVFRFHQLGQIPAVALMGRTLSAEQEELLERSGALMLTLALDADAPGRKATEELFPRLSEKFGVKGVYLADGESPDTVSADLLLSILEPS